MNFKEIWLKTDKMNYNLNNVRKKGRGERFEDMEDTQFPTSIVVTTDIHSRYVFLSDVAYDWDITFGDIALDTILYKEDHLNEFARKNGRFGKYSAFPQPPSKNDTQTKSEYENDLKKFVIRECYIEGLHINATYTTSAHLWLIKQLVKATEWRFVTDKDNSLMSSIYRVFSGYRMPIIFFAKLIKQKQGHKLVKNLNKPQWIYLIGGIILAMIPSL